MDPWIYPRERTLGRLTLVLGVLAWVSIIVGTLGIALLLVLAILVVYLFVQSAFISWVKGNGVRLAAEQLPDVYQQYEDCCARLGLKDRPEAYVLHGDGAMNAFAVRFLRREFVVLLSATVDAMAQHPDGVRFYLGHELGHVRLKHLTGWLWRAPVLWLPLLGAAYSRAREYSCDRHGAACCASPDHAARALAALAAGPERWRDLQLAGFAAQSERTREYWMSFNELINGYPWLCKRVHAVLNPAAAMPQRHPLGWVLAILVPHTGWGLGGLLLTLYLLMVLGGLAVPAYLDYGARTQAELAWQASGAVRDALAFYYEQNQEIPESLEALGLPATLANGNALTYDEETMVVSVTLPNGGVLELVPSDDEDKVVWECQAGPGLRPSALPAACRPSDEAPE